MNIQAIQMVVCVAEELSFSRAAEKLFVSQPAISKQIQQMERELGVALFKRDRHQVELTPAGAACLPLFQQMKRDYERVQRIARRFDTDVQGSVGIALNLTHDAATPVGMKVWAESTVTAINGRKVSFSITAYDETGVIGTCDHQRAIIDNEKFFTRCQNKLNH